MRVFHSIALILGRKKSTTPFSENGKSSCDIISPYAVHIFVLQENFMYLIPQFRAQPEFPLRVSDS